MRKLKLSKANVLSALIGSLATISWAQQPAKTNLGPQQLEDHKPIERELKAKETHSYVVLLQAGQFLDATVTQLGVDVVVRVFAPDGKLMKEIDSPNGAEGDEAIILTAETSGPYRIEVRELEQEARDKLGRYVIKINEMLSADAYAKRLVEHRQKQRTVIAALKANAIPIKTVEAGSGFDDLRPLRRILKEVRFVGLGEATHGTREFFQFKHRMIEFLVREMGFRVFAIEASYSACENINDYVMGKTSDGAGALDSQRFWTWNTEEVRAMLDWMRSYNASVDADRKVKFVGFDIQWNATGRNKLLEYIKRVAPERFAETEALLKIEEGEILAKTAFGKSDQDKAAQAQTAEIKNKYNALFAWLDLEGPQLIARSTLAEYEKMREYARVILQYIDAYDSRGVNGLSRRDLYMADIFRRLVEAEPAGTRFILWAHNGHIATGNNGGAYPTLGYHLRGFYGRNYYALGFSFNQGAFQARELEPKNPERPMLTAFTANPAPDDSADWYLAQTGTRSFVLDFRSARKSPEFEEWLGAPHPMRRIGSAYAPNLEANFFTPTAIGKEFDGVFFIDKTTRARPNPSVKNVAAMN